MKVALSGTNGYIGRNLIQKLSKNNIEWIALTRKDLYNVQALTEKLRGTGAVIHLAGAPILKRWTKINKQEIIESRVLTTKNITEAINLLQPNQRPEVLVSASAIGIYANDVEHDESSKLFSDDFVGQVVRKWENSSSELDSSVRKVIFRIGLVIGKNSATISRMRPVFELGFGGQLGSGKQAFPFIHISDVVAAIMLAVSDPKKHGIYNLVAPEKITNCQFTSELAAQLKRPAIFTVPKFMLKIVFGEASSLLIKSPIVKPERLLESDFEFNFPDIKSALGEILQNSPE